MNDTQKLRMLVRELVKDMKAEEAKQYKQYLKEKKELRKHVRNLLQEVDQVAPHASTAINTLRDLLKTIIPILEEGYKNLTSDPNQRKSFRSHIIVAVRNILAPVDMYFNADSKKKNTATGSGNMVSQPSLPKEPNKTKPKDAVGAEEELTELAGEPLQKIDVPTSSSAKAGTGDVKLKTNAFTPIAGEDATGRNFALRSFQKVEKQILDAYGLLQSEEDRNIFFEYLVTNLKLYFDQFEDELKASIEEPSTQQYDSQKQQQAAGTGMTQPQPQQGMGELEAGAGSV